MLGNSFDREEVDRLHALGTGISATIPGTTRWHTAIREHWPAMSARIAELEAERRQIEACVENDDCPDLPLVSRVASAVSNLVTMIGKWVDAKEERDKLLVRVAELEASQLREITERDEWSDLFDKICGYLGVETEYSNVRSADDVLVECGERIGELLAVESASELARMSARVAELEAMNTIAGPVTIEDIEKGWQERYARMKAESLRATATELESLREHIKEYVGPDDAIDEIRRICLSRAKDLRDEADRLEKEGQ